MFKIYASSGDRRDVVGATKSRLVFSPTLLIVVIGKTTLARVLANGSDSRLVELSATSSGTAEVRAAFEEAKNALKLTGKWVVLLSRHILFAD